MCYAGVLRAALSVEYFIEFYFPFVSVGKEETEALILTLQLLHI